MAIRVKNQILPPADNALKGAIIVGEKLSITPEGLLDVKDLFPSQPGNEGKYLTTDGTNIMWGGLEGEAEVDKVDTTLSTDTYLNGNEGKAIINVTTDPGSYVTIAKYPTTNGKMTINGYNETLLVGYTSNDTIENKLNQLDKKVTLLDESGNTIFPGTVTANFVQSTAYRSQFADLAEKYLSDINYTPGTLVQFGGTYEITLARNTVNGVVSEKPGFVLNNKRRGVTVALCGKTKIRVEGKVNKHDKLMLSKKTPGIACKKNWYNIFSKTIGIAFETKTEEKEYPIMCFTRITI